MSSIFQMRTGHGSRPQRLFHGASREASRAAATVFAEERAEKNPCHKESLRRKEWVEEQGIKVGSVVIHQNTKMEFTVMEITKHYTLHLSGKKGTFNSLLFSVKQ